MSQEPSIECDPETSGQATAGLRPVVAIASSLDAVMGPLRAPLNADLTAEQVRAIVWRALDLDTSPRSLRDVVRPGDWVVVKPNIVTSPTNPNSMYWLGGVPHRGQNTDLRAVKAVVDYILRHCRPRRITIAEGGAEWLKVGEPDTPPEIAEDGWTVHWSEYGGLSYADLVADWAKTHPGVVDLVDLNYDQRRFGPVPDPRGSGYGALQRLGAVIRPLERYGRGSCVEGTGVPREGYAMPATILDCDILVSCPAMKNHLTCGTSLSIKNYVGITPPGLNPPGSRLGRNHKNPAHEGEISRGFVDAFSYHPADYCVVEGFWGTEGNGPQWGDDVQHNVVLAGADAVAVDAVGSTVMGYNPEDLEYLQLASMKRFGEMDARRVQVVGTPIPDVQRRFRMGTGRTGQLYAGRGVRDWLVTSDEPTGESPVGERWTRIHSQDRYFDLAYHLGPDAPAALWAYTAVECDEAVTLEAWVGSDGPVALSVAGEPPVQLDPIDSHRVGELRAPLRLPAGHSGLLLRVKRGAGGFGLSLLLCGEPGCLPLGVHYRSPGESEAAAARRLVTAKPARY